MELKPCPFCGEDRMLDVQASERDGRSDCKYTAKVVCLNCFASACIHGFDWFEDEAKDKAVRAWNRRKELR